VALLWLWIKMKYSVLFVVNFSLSLRLQNLKVKSRKYTYV
jgi:hypothetical protein